MTYESAGDIQAPRVLIVCDEPMAEATLCARIAADLPGVEVDRVRSGPVALDCVRSANYCFILVDLRLPGMKSLELIGFIRVLQPWAHAVLLSPGAGSPEKLLGGTWCLPRAFDPELLLSYLKSALSDPDIVPLVPMETIFYHHCYGD